MTDQPKPMERQRPIDHVVPYKKKYREREYMRDYQRKRRARLLEAVRDGNEGMLRRRLALKRKAIALLGGKCSVCGREYPPECYDFHHTDPDVNLARVSQMFLRGDWDTIAKEIQKCILLCSNCHRTLHAKNRTLRKPDRRLQRKAVEAEADALLPTEDDLERLFPPAGRKRRTEK